jgi:ABC-type sugar transport system ATPase subunit
MLSEAVAQILEMRGVSKSFSGIPALVDVDFSAQAGEVHSIVGQNGAGKSTLMNILAGVLRPDKGEIRIAGANAAITDTAHALRLGVATVYQELSLLPNLTVSENFFLGRQPLRGPFVDRRAMNERARDFLVRVGCGEVDPRTLVEALPLARRQLIEIAKALSFDPAVLVLDEPTASLAKDAADRLFQIVSSLRKRGVAIVFISHRFLEVLAHADRVTILRNGRVVETRKISGVDEQYLVERMIGGAAANFYAGGRTTVPAPRPVAVEIRDITLAGRVRATTLTVEAGAIVALTGLLGAGQNEVARILGGDMTADSGVIVRSGKAVGAGPFAAIKAGICLLTEDRKAEGLFLGRSVSENLALPSLQALSSLGIVDARAERRAVDAAIAQFSIAATARSIMGRLSGGNQQKTILARWLLRDLAVLVLIEPTRGIDVGAKADIYRHLESLARLGKAIIVVSSDALEGLGLADCVVVFVDGAVRAQYRRGEISEEALNLAIQGKG